MDKPIFNISDKSKYKDIYLDNLVNALNENREGTKYKKLEHARVNTMLKKLGKSKKNWDRDIWIANVLDSKNAAKYFWWKIKQ